MKRGTLLDKLRGLMSAPVTLTRGVELIEDVYPLAPDTVRLYGIVVRRFVGWVGDDLLIDDVTPQLVEDFAATLRQDLSAASASEYARQLKTFFTKMVELGHLDVSPARRLRVKRYRRADPKAASPEEIQLIIKAAGRSANPYRDEALVRVMADSGARIGGLSSMLRRATRVVEDDGRLWGVSEVEKKGGGYYAIMFGDDAARALNRYLERRTDSLPFVWISRQGNQMDPQGISRVVRTAAKKAGVKHVTAHWLRHAFAKEALKAGIEIGVISKMMGHKSVDTTIDIYLRFGRSDLMDAFQDLQKRRRQSSDD